ncbi:MAG: D-alanyl-D-alanine carboxypeptidase family protein [Candidatus Paceibacterota bacterium]
MIETLNEQNNWQSIVVSIIAVLAIAGSVYLWIQLDQSQQQITQYEETQVDLQEQLTQLREQLSATEADNEELREDLEVAENRNEEFEERIEELGATVGDIARYTSVDPELLKKYSRVFFLSENYVPSDLARIDRDYVYNRDVEQFHEHAYPFLEDMIEDAENDDIELKVISAFRSFQEQNSINNSYTITYGAGTANQFSAEQGYSEHQLGTTADFTTPELAANFEDFASTAAYEWLLDNAHDYGFVLSYPEGNAYYIFEPWHWRFVGVELAQEIEDDGDHFYDWEQRDIDEYRGKLFEN